MLVLWVSFQPTFTLTHVLLEHRHFATKHSFVPNTPSFTMAAAAAGIQNYFENTLGIADAAVRDALVAEGLDNFTVLKNLTDKDITEMCENCKAPGGTIPNPAYHATNNPNVAQNIRNPGIRIGHVTYTLLRQLQYFGFAMARVGRTVTAANATLECLSNTWKRYQLEKDYNAKPDKPPKLEKVKDVRKTIENLKSYFAQKYGSNDAALSYVIRTEGEVPAVADDYGFGVPSHNAELERRLKHEGPAYEADNVLVWTIIRHVTHGGPAWPWVQQHARTQDGREAFLSLRTHYLGTAFQNRIKLKADADLEAAFFDNMRNFTHEDYCQNIISAINDLRDANEEMPVNKQIRIYMKGLQDPRLAATKEVAMGLPDVTASLQSCMNFMSQQLAMIESYAGSNKRRRVAGVGGRGGGSGGRGGRSGRGRGGRGRGRGDSSSSQGRGGRGSDRGFAAQDNPNITISDRYYTPEEWATMSLTQQRAAMEFRSNRRQQMVMQSYYGGFVPPPPPPPAQSTGQQHNDNASSMTPDMSRRPRGS